MQDGVEQFSAHEREELTETEFSQEGQPIIPLSECEDPLHYEDPVMHISGTGHWFWRVGSAIIRWNSWLIRGFR